MEEIFAKQVNLGFLEDCMKNKEPLLFTIVSTTGVSEIDMPIKVCAKQYIFDKEVQGYVEKSSFAEMVQCSEEALKHAIDCVGNYDVFYNGGINQEEYAKGTNVLSQSQFKEKFDSFLNSVEPNSQYVVNSSKFTLSMLDKIDCADCYKLAKEEYRYVDILEVGKEMLTRDNATEYMNVTKSGKVSLPSLPALYSYINGKPHNEEDVIIGGEKRISAMFETAVWDARKLNLIPSDREQHFATIHKEQYDDMVQRGKTAYQNASNSQKAEFWKKKGIITENIDRNTDCDLNKLLDFLSGEDKKKGIVTYQVATTGFNNGNKPIQIAMTSYVLDDNQNLKVRGVMATDIAISSKDFDKVINDKTFDAFAYTGIDVEKYKNGDNSFAPSVKNVASIDNAIDMIMKFHKLHNEEEWLYLSNGKVNNSDLTYSQSALVHLANMPINKIPTLDFSQIVKEYTSLCISENKENAIFKDTNPQNLSLSEIGTSLDIETTSTLDKVCAMMSAVDCIYAQFKAEKSLELAQNENTKENTNEKAVSNNDKLTTNSANSTINYDYIDVDYEDYIDDDYGISDIDNEVHEKATRSQFENGMSQEELDILSEIEGEPLTSTETVTKVTKTETVAYEKTGASQNREIYSNIKNDKVPIIKVDGEVTKVGETPIKHISEVAKEVSKSNTDTNKVVVAESNNADLSALIKAIAEQTVAFNSNTEALKEQNAILREQNAIMKEQNALYLNAFASIVKTIDNADREQPKTVLETLDNVADNIKTVMDKVSGNAKDELRKANECISKSQQIIDKDTDKTVRKQAIKG